MQLNPGLSAARARSSPLALAGVLIAHAGLLAWLTRPPAPPTQIEPPRPLIVQLITPVREAAVASPRTSPRAAQVTRPSTVQAAPPRTPPPPPSPPEPAPPPDPLPTAPVELALAASAPPPAPERPLQASTPAAPIVDASETAPRSSPTTTPPQAADYLNNPPPTYPALSKRLGEEGTVRLRILVNAEGGVDRLELDRSSGHSRLDRAAMETVLSTWKFEPARQAGKPVKAWAVVPIQFTLRR